MQNSESTITNNADEYQIDEERHTEIDLTEQDGLKESQIRIQTLKT